MKGMITTMRYVGLGGRRIPKTVPQGARLVHNRVYPEGRNATGDGFQGSRSWLQYDQDQRMELCRCKFAPDLTHYRIKLSLLRKWKEKKT